ncbi:MAG: protease synthase and sporulation protein 2 [Pseudomonadota bacterium]|jgi:transcriptional regulator
MYVPSHFRVSDENALTAFIEAHSFATLVTRTPDDVFVSHVPLLLRRSVSGLALIGHVARANRHWQFMDGEASSLAIFHGPHAYISPRWYESKNLVPTWNYAAVHARGTPKIRHDDAFATEVVSALTRQHEGSHAEAWRVEVLPSEHLSNLVRAIVAFEMPILSLEGKFKLSQNRSEADLVGAINGLEKTDAPNSLEVAALMRRRLPHPHLG